MRAGIVNLLLTLAIVTALAYWMLSRGGSKGGAQISTRRLESQGIVVALPSDRPLPAAIEQQVQGQVNQAIEVEEQKIDRASAN